MSIADELRKLQELRDAGVLTNDEFAKAKASLLATVISPEGVAQADERAVRIRNQLAEFKSRFANAGEYDMRVVLEEAEDLLISVCGQDRYRDFIRAAQQVRNLLNDLKETRGGDAYRERNQLRREISEELESLNRRIAGIEYR